MESGFTVRLSGATLRAAGIAAALACGAGASWADDATLNIRSFTVSAAEFSGQFVWVTDRYQSFDMSALEAGGLNGAASDVFSDSHWDMGPNRIAQTTNARATGNPLQFTDSLTQLTTPGFNLGAWAAPGAYSLPVLPNEANASALQSGTFVLLDETGALAGGTITFDLWYDMSVTTPLNLGVGYSQTVLNVLSSTDGGGSADFGDGLLSTSLRGGAGATSGHFSWTFTLAAGEAAYYTLSGSAISVAAVPEPGTYALMALGLAGIGVVARRRRGSAA